MSNRRSPVQNEYPSEELFAEKLGQFRVREYKDNTRLNIKNIDYAQQKEKRDRAINYWSQNIASSTSGSPGSKKYQRQST